MKWFVALIGFTLLANPLNAQDEETSLRTAKYIDSLIQKKSFFKAREHFNARQSELIEFDKLLIGASLDNAFNKLAASNAKIERLFAEYNNRLTDTSTYSLLNIRQINYSKQFEYRMANASIGEIIELYTYLLTDKEKKDFENTSKIWRALANQPKQEVIIKNHTVLKLKRDKAQLTNLEVKSGKKKCDFIFDTGANISTCTQSTARKLKMKMLEAEIKVTSITGLKVKSGLAICPKLEIGDIVVKNVVFLVFPDEALAVPQIKYQINGILGFPVIEALGEVQLTQKDEFIVPLKQTIVGPEQKNLALDFLTPIIEIKGDSYSFDTGADETMLYNTYYNKHKNFIDSTATETDYTFGGAGGSVTKRGFYISFDITYNNRNITLEKIIVLKEALKDENPLFGNIGQDFIKKFSKMTLNFDEMFIKFD
jgi:predicted aspartyl protease